MTTMLSPHGHRLALVVGHQDRRDFELLLEQLEFHLHFFAQLGIKRGERLVEQQQRWLLRQGTRDRDTLALAAGKLVDTVRLPIPGSRISASNSSTRARRSGRLRLFNFRL